MRADHLAQIPRGPRLGSSGRARCCPLTARVCALDHPGGLQNHSRLRTPPPPLSHAHTPSQHHAASINSLNRGNFTPRSNPSPAPTDHSLSGEPPACGAQEPAHAQDNWLLNSNIPLETRYWAVGRLGLRLRGVAGGQRALRLRPQGLRKLGSGTQPRDVALWLPERRTMDGSGAERTWT